MRGDWLKVLNSISMTNCKQNKGLIYKIKFIILNACRYVDKGCSGKRNKYRIRLCDYCCEIRFLLDAAGAVDGGGNVCSKKK